MGARNGRQKRSSETVVRNGRQEMRDEKGDGNEGLCAFEGAIVSGLAVSGLAISGRPSRGLDWAERRHC
jgi:hypothetical protein